MSSLKTVLYRITYGESEVSSRKQLCDTARRMPLTKVGKRNAFVLVLFLVGQLGSGRSCSVRLGRNFPRNTNMEGAY